MLDKIIEIDQQLLLWINAHHSPWLDQIIYSISQDFIWMVGIYLILAFSMIYKKGWKLGSLYFAAMAAAIGLADLFTSRIMKPNFARLRPTHESNLQEFVHTVNDYSGGLYGFSSGHAATIFAGMTVVYLGLKSDYKMAWLVYIWASFIAYTRMYLGVHFPMDILVGAIIGIVFGCLLNQVVDYFKVKYPSLLKS